MDDQNTTVRTSIRILTITCTILSSFHLSLFSQTLLWSITNDNPSPSNDVPNCPVVDASGVYFAGFDSQLGSANEQFRIEKRDLATGTILNPSFGTGGIVQENFSTQYDIIDIDGIDIDATGIYTIGVDHSLGTLKGQWRMQKRDLTTGATIWSQFSNPSSGAGDDQGRGISVDASGVYLTGKDESPGSFNDQWRIEKRDLATGALITSFGTGGFTINNPSPGSDAANCIVSDGIYLYIAGYDKIPGNDEWRIEKRDAVTGSLIAAFGTGGAVTFNFSPGSDQAAGIAVDTTGIYITGNDESPGNNQWHMLKLDKVNGSTIWDQVSNPSGGYDYPYDIEVDGIAAYITGFDFSPGDSQVRIEKRSLTTGIEFPCSPAVNNPTPGNDWFYGIVVDGSENIYGCGVLGGGDNGWLMQKWNMCCTTALITGNNAICSGTSTILTANGGGTYSWDNGSTTAAITVSPSTTTSYTVTATNNGCSGSASVQVTVTSPPAPTISGPTTICSGSSTTLTATGGGTYSWSDGSTTAAITVSPSSNTTYTVTVSNGGCTGSASVQVTVGSSLVPTISGTNTICSGTSTTLTASGGGTYSWNTGETTAAITVSPTTNTTYTVTVSNGTCSGTATQTVTITPNPTPTISGNTAICNGGSTTLTASGGTSYSWNTGETTAAITVSPTTGTTYTVTATDNGCTGSTTVAVTIGVNPSPTISGNTTICTGTSTTLTASGGTSYSWNTGDLTPSVTVSPTATTTYTVTATDNGCTGTATIQVTVSNNLSPAITGSNTICSGNSTTLTTNGGGTYSWNTGETTSSITVSPTTNTTYSVTVSNGTCTGTASVQVTVNPNPTPTISGTTTICSGQNTTLTANGGASYSWNTGATTNSITVTPTANTTYTVTATDNGCTGTATIQVNVNPTPAAAITGNTTICTGQSTTLTATGSGSYSWNTGATTNTITVSPTNTTTYTLSVTNNGCTGTATQTVTVVPPVVAAITGSNICLGESATLTASGGTFYVWNTGATTSSITVSPTSTSSYTVAAAVGSCVDTASYTVTVNPIPVATVSPDITINYGNSTNLSSSGGGSYSWTPPNGLSCTTCQNPIASPTEPTQYCVTVTNSGGCSDSACMNIKVDLKCGDNGELYVPNGFSPNNDGQNDLLFVRGGGITELYWVIYDRWGEKVFETKDPKQGWDGTYKGKLLDPAVFVYYLNITCITGDTITQKGNVAIVK
jgi:gliding motility-associated-like protein